FHSALNGAHRFFQVNDDTLARSARLSHTVTAVAQAIISGLGHHGTRLGAAHVQRNYQVFALIPHAYGFPCPFGIAGLGLVLGFFPASFAGFGATVAAAGVGGGVGAVAMVLTVTSPLVRTTSRWLLRRERALAGFFAIRSEGFAAVGPGMVALGL